MGAQGRVMNPVLVSSEAEVEGAEVIVQGVTCYVALNSKVLAKSSVFLEPVAGLVL
jgi:hypothetical protein